MRFSTSMCPECGGDPVSFVETGTRWEHITKDDEGDNLDYDYMGDHDEGDVSDSSCIEECHAELAEAARALVLHNFDPAYWAAVERLVEELEGHQKGNCVTLCCEVMHTWHSMVLPEAIFAPETSEDTP